MDTRRPHAILPESAVQDLPPQVRRFFAPIPPEDVERVQRMGEDERARYVAELVASRATAPRGPHPAERTEHDLARLERARLRRERRRRG